MGFSYEEMFVILISLGNFIKTTDSKLWVKTGKNGSYEIWKSTNINPSLLDENVLNLTNKIIKFLQQNMNINEFHALLKDSCLIKE